MNIVDRLILVGLVTCSSYFFFLLGSSEFTPKSLHAKTQHAYPKSQFAYLETAVHNTPDGLSNEELKVIAQDLRRQLTEKPEAKVVSKVEDILGPNTVRRNDTEEWDEIATELRSIVRELDHL